MDSSPATTTLTRWCKRVTQLIQEVRENKGDLAVLWLDLSNAYGSFPYKLVQTDMTKHHVFDSDRAGTSGVITRY